MEARPVRWPQPAVELRFALLRGLAPGEELGFVRSWTAWVERMGWDWHGTQLAGRVAAPAGLCADDCVSLLGWLLEDGRLARVELDCDRHWLRVPAGWAGALDLCRLHRQHLIEAGVVLQTLGGREPW